MTRRSCSSAWRAQSAFSVFVLRSLLVAAVGHVVGHDHSECGAAHLPHYPHDNQPKWLREHPEEVRSVAADCDWRTLSGFNPRHVYSPSAGNVLVVPTVMHIIYNGNTGEWYVPMDVALESINNVNLALRNVDPSAWLTPDRAKAVDTKIELRLATTTPGGEPTTGIIYYNRPDWVNEETSLSIYSAARRESCIAFLCYAWDPQQFLNIYSFEPLRRKEDGELVGFAGFAYLASWSAGAWFDGVYMDYSRLVSSTLAHEVGHWLDLKHTFADEDVCPEEPSGPNVPGTKCYETDDQCCDTEPQNAPTGRVKTVLSSMTRTCLEERTEDGAPTSSCGSRDPMCSPRCLPLRALGASVTAPLALQYDLMPLSVRLLVLA